MSEDTFVRFGSDVAWPLSAPEKKMVKCCRCEGKGGTDVELALHYDCWMCDGTGKHEAYND